MIVNNLQQALDYAGIEKLPKEQAYKQPFKRAIGKIQTSCADESYAILKYYENEPVVVKSFIGGIFIKVLNIYPYEFDGQNIGFRQAADLDIKDVYKQQQTYKHEVNGGMPIIDEKLLEQMNIASKAKSEWLIDGITNIEEARKFMMKHNKIYPTALSKARIKNEARFKDEYLKFAKHYLSLKAK